MTYEDIIYQEFFAKTIQKGQEFANDYYKLSQSNKDRFWKDLATSAEIKEIVEICKQFINNF